MTRVQPSIGALRQNRCGRSGSLCRREVARRRQDCNSGAWGMCHKGACRTKVPYRSVENPVEVPETPVEALATLGVDRNPAVSMRDRNATGYVVRRCRSRQGGLTVWKMVLLAVGQGAAEVGRG